MSYKWVLSALSSAVLCATWGGLAQAADWTVAAKSNSGDTFEIDLDTLSRRGSIVDSWLRTTNANPERDHQTGKLFTQSVAKRSDDCENRRLWFGSFVNFDRNGNTVSSGQSEATWADIAPGSVGEAVWRVVCAAANPPKQDAWVDQIAAGDWLKVGHSADNKYDLSIKLDEIVPIKNGLVMVASRSDYISPEWIDEFPVTHIVTVNAIDCRLKTTASLGSDFYIGESTRVRSVRTDKVGFKFESIKPGSFIEHSLNRVCSQPTTNDAPTRVHNDQKPQSVGTAWGVTKGYLVTASHVVSGAKSIGVYSNGEPIGSARIVADDPANDLAVLKLTTRAGAKIAVLPLSGKGAALGRSVFTLGYPEPTVLGQRIKMTAGEVSSTSGAQDDARFIQISVPIQPGNSGGPIIGWDGTVLGIVEAKLTRFDDDHQSPTPEMVNYALKASYLRPLLEDLPDLGNYVALRPTPQPQPDALVAEARKAVFMVVVSN